MDDLSGFMKVVAEAQRSLSRKGLRRPCRLGDVIGGILADVQVAQDKAAQIEAVWAEVVPAHVATRCRVGKLEHGQLHVTVNSPVYGYELQLCSHELVSQIRQRWPRLGLRTIKVTVA